MGPKKPSPQNPLVYLDIRIGPEYAGRLVIELRKDVAPKTAENFRRLCIGDHWSEHARKHLHYKNTKIHKVQRIFAIQGGDVISAGSSGESIYGPMFEDETFELLHDEGAVSMSNFGKPNTNNSQFFITSVQCLHLDGSHVVCGYVIRGIGIIGEMEAFADDDGRPLVEIVIENCGEIQPNESWGFYDADDHLPPFPIDWEESAQCTSVDDVSALLSEIKTLGNQFYNQGNCVDALRKYKKYVRYHQFFSGADHRLSTLFAKLTTENLLNIAACHVKLGNFKEAVSYCNDILREDPNQSKALYRRGVAKINLKDYESGLDDLRQAHSLSPDDKSILEQFNRGKDLLMEYRCTEKTTIQRMFKDMN